MNRKDMQLGVMYAIQTDGYNTRPGYVLDITKPPNKIKVKTFWIWPGQDEDYLNPEPPLHLEGAKSDVKHATTAGIIGLWSDYCATTKAERKALLDAKLAEEAEEVERREADLARVDVVGHKIIQAFPSMVGTMRYYAKTGNLSTYTFSSKDVLDLIEYLTTVKS